MKGSKTISFKPSQILGGKGMTETPLRLAVRPGYSTGVDVGSKQNQLLECLWLHRDNGLIRSKATRLILHTIGIGYLDAVRWEGTAFHGEKPRFLRS